MAYVIYHKDTTLIWPRWDRQFATERAAKARLTRDANSGKLKGEKDEYAIAEVGDFRANIEKKVIQKNLLSGKEYEEGVNTPAFMSPASDIYWSM